MAEETDYSDLDMVVDDAAYEQNGDGTSNDDFVVLPKGEYPYTVSKVSFENYQPKAGKTTGITKPCKKIRLGLIVDGGDKGKAWVDENLYFYPTCMYKILSVFKSVGLISDGFKGTLPWDELKDKTGRAKFDVESYHSTKYNDDRERMVAKTFLKPAASDVEEDLPF